MVGGRASDGLVQAAAVIVIHCHPVGADGHNRTRRRKRRVEVGLGGEREVGREVRRREGGRREGGEREGLLLDMIKNVKECLVYVRSKQRHFHPVLPRYQNKDPASLTANLHITQLSSG